MPKLLDVIIGLAVVMLVVSMAVTLLTQFVTSLFNTGGKALQSGLANLIAQIDSSIAKASPKPKTGTMADEIAGAILTHPMIAEPFWGLVRNGTVIHRDELTKLLLDLAVPATAAAQSRLAPETLKALKDVLTAHGIPNPTATLDKIRMTALELERTKPELPSNLWYDTAIIQEAKSQFVAKINAWFDQTVDRVSSNFTLSTRLITFACAALVAVLLQLDTIALVNGLWTSDALRQELIDHGIAMLNPGKPQPGVKAAAHPGGKPAKTPAHPSPAAYHYQAVNASSDVTLQPVSGNEPTKSDEAADPNGSPTDDAQKAREEEFKQAKEAAKYLDYLSKYDFVAFPALNGGSAWLIHWSIGEIPGIFLSALLLSMGAPFWYSTLQTLLRLRSQSSETDDKQRNFRKDSQPDSAAEPDKAAG